LKGFEIEVALVRRKQLGALGIIEEDHAARRVDRDLDGVSCARSAHIDARYAKRGKLAPVTHRGSGSRS
jgi:hypothetical protein